MITGRGGKGSGCSTSCEHIYVTAGIEPNSVLSILSSIKKMDTAFTGAIFLGYNVKSPGLLGNIQVWDFEFVMMIPLQPKGGQSILTVCFKPGPVSGP